MPEIVGAAVVEVPPGTVRVPPFERAPPLPVTVTVAVPVWPEVGLPVTVRLAPLPPNVIPEFGTSVALLELPLSVRLPAVVSASPTVKLIGPTVVPAVVVWLGMLEIVGAVLVTGAALTVSVKLRLAVVVPSFTVRLTVAVPVWPAAAFTVTVRVPPLPPRVMLPLGTSVVLLDEELSVRLPAAVSA